MAAAKREKNQKEKLGAGEEKGKKKLENERVRERRESFGAVKKERKSGRNKKLEKERSFGQDLTSICLLHQTYEAAKRNSLLRVHCFRRKFLVSPTLIQSPTTCR